MMAANFQEIAAGFCRTSGANSSTHLLTISPPVRSAKMLVVRSSHDLNSAARVGSLPSVSAMPHTRRIKP